MNLSTFTADSEHIGVYLHREKISCPVCDNSKKRHDIAFHNVVKTQCTRCNGHGICVRGLISSELSPGMTFDMHIDGTLGRMVIDGFVGETGSSKR